MKNRLAKYVSMALCLVMLITLLPAFPAFAGAQPIEAPVAFSQPGAAPQGNASPVPGDGYFTYNGAQYWYSSGYEGSILVKFTAEAIGLPLHEDVVEIQSHAVEGLSDLTEFTIPGTVKYIGVNAFYDLPALETVHLEPSAEGLRLSFSAQSFGGTTGIPDFTVEENDERFFVRDGVLYDKPDMSVLMVSGGKTVLDLAEDIKGIHTYPIPLQQTLERITVRAEDFDFFSDDMWRYSSLQYMDENTEIVCRRGSNAENYALRFGGRLTYLDGVDIAEISIVADAPLEVEVKKEFNYSQLPIHAEVRYSDGVVNTFPAVELFYVMDDKTFPSSGNSLYRYEEVEEHTVSVQFGGVAQTFPFYVIPSRTAYRFDVSEARTDFAVWELISASNLNIKLWEPDPTSGEESEVNLSNCRIYLWENDGWARVNYGSSTFSSAIAFSVPGAYRIKLEYLGHTQEWTLNVTEDDIRFTTNENEAITEVPQYTVYDKAYGGNRLFVTRNGETEELTAQVTLKSTTVNNYVFPSIHFVDNWNHYPDTSVLGDTVVCLHTIYTFTDAERGERRFDVNLPLELHVVPGEIADAYLDVSAAPEYVPPEASLTAKDLGVKLVKTMSDGSTQIDDDPAVYFIWRNLTLEKSGDTLLTDTPGEQQAVTVLYGGLTAHFSVTMLPHTMTYVPASAAADCRETGELEHWHCTDCGRNYKDEVGRWELADVSDGVYGAHAPGDLHPGYAPTCTEDGLGDYCECTVCGKLTDAAGQEIDLPVIPALGHDYAETARANPACTEDGYIVYTCRNDETHTYTETLPATGHRNRIWKDKIEATATAHGHEAGDYCTDCGKYVTGGEVIHNKNGARYRVQDATWLDQETYDYCCANGDYIIYCSVCGEYGLYAKQKLIDEGILSPEPESPPEEEDEGFFEKIKTRFDRMMSGVINFLLRLIRWFGSLKG